MQEQNFEKQVHNLMDDLVIPPSTPVWNKVEEQIRRKRDRRRIAFWILPLLLISTGFLWWMIASENKIDTSKSSDRSTTGLSQDNTQKTGEGIEKNSLETTTSSVSGPVIKNVPLQTYKRTDLSNNTTNKIIQPKIKNPETVISNKTSIDETPNNDYIVSNIQPEKTKTSNVLVETQSLKKIDSLKSERTTLIGIEDEQLGKDSTINTNEETETDVAVEKENLEKQVITAKQTTLKIVPYLAGGFSNVSKGLFLPVASADFAGTQGNTPSSGFSSLPPSAPEKSLYFSAGLKMIKSFNNRLEISTGLQYSFFSTKISIGSRVVNDTTLVYSNLSFRVQDYYRNGNANKYVNKYHFISLPASVEYQLFKKIPLSLQAGISLNQLVSTNALLYNSNSNIQFENDKAWNKTQFHISSGINYHFLKNKSFSFKAGPFIQYSLTGLEKTSNRNQFLSVAGLQTHFYFMVKK